MEIVLEIPEPCDSVSKIKKFCAERQQAGYRDLGMGSIVLCDCGEQFILNETAEFGREWIKVVGGVSLRA